MIGDVIAVMGDEVLKHPLDFQGGHCAALRRQTALDHHPSAAADHVAGGLIGDRRQAFAGKDGVEGGDQIGRGVDQGAVEVEDDGGMEHHAERGSVRARARQARRTARSYDLTRLHLGIDAR